MGSCGRSLLACIGFLLACSAPAAQPPCDLDDQCDDGNPCTADACVAGGCQNPVDDDAQPPQAAGDDCMREICAGGAVVSVIDDGEMPPQSGASCWQEICADGLIDQVLVPAEAGGCDAAQYCDVDFGCQDGVRDLVTEPSDILVVGDDDFARLTDPNSLAVGDFDGDGSLDMALGEPIAGRVLVALGPLSGVVDLRTDALVIDRPDTGANTGSVVTACDFNGDLQQDLLITVPEVTVGALENAGLVFGLLGPIVADMDLSDGADLTIAGTQEFTAPARTVACMDVSGDGVDDVVLGGPLLDGKSRNEPGQVTLFLGGAGLVGERTLDDADVTITGHSERMHLGGNLAAGDFDSDGRPDLVIAAPAISTQQLRPEQIVILPGDSLFDGTGDPLVLDVDLAVFPAAQYVGGGDRRDFGVALATADFDDDGFDDLAIGSAFAEPSSLYEAGEVALLHGGSTGITDLDIEVSLAGVTMIRGNHEADHLGASLTVGDHNGDLLPDLFIGAPGVDGDNSAPPSMGAGMLFLGGPRLAPDLIHDLAETNPDLIVSGIESYDEYATAVRMADVDGDGKDDLLLAAPGGDGAPAAYRPDVGEVAVVLAP
jgi:hypothetical protein